MPLDLTEAQTILDLWLLAEKAVATGQSYSIGGRSLTRTNAAEITEKIKFWQNQVNALTESGGAVVKRVVPRDI